MLAETLRAIGAEFPASIAQSASTTEINRALFNLSLIQKRIQPPAKIADLGAGMGLFPLAAVKSGYTFYAIDDYRDPVNFMVGDAAVNVLKSHGVNVIEQDIMSAPLPFEPSSLDAITTFDCMEHLHKSPKKLFANCMQILRPGGVFVIGVPNCVNLRKRITVPLGRGKWTRMEDWYDQEVFRGHVREPDVADLRYIARDMGLENVEVVGRNWLGLISGNKLISAATAMVDPVLRLLPTLCANIYMVGSKRR